MHGNFIIPIIVLSNQNNYIMSNKATFTHAEQLKAGSQIIFLTDKGFYATEERQVLAFITENRLNVETTGHGLTSDPDGTEEEITIDENQYLDDNWDKVTKMFYNSIFK